MDIFLTNNLDLIKSTKVISGVSDHEAVIIESKLYIKTKKPKKRKIYQWKKVNMTKLKSDANYFSRRFKTSHQKNEDSNINNMWSCIKKHLEQIIEDNVPTMMTNSKVYQPWITTQTKRLIKNKNKWYAKMKRRKDDQSKMKYQD